LFLQNELPGVFSENFYPYVINGSLWTLPVEFLCYVSVAVAGRIPLIRKDWVLGLVLGLTVLAAAWGPEAAGAHFIAHFEMVSFFWWGVWYGYASANASYRRKEVWVYTALALTAFFVLGSRGLERTALMLFAGNLVLLAQRVSLGASLTDRLGDLSYGMYIFAFPVQQILVALGRGRGWPFGMYLGMSFFVTAGLAYVSWHLIEKRALFFKPKAQVMP
jgi:peptidoglycan/LPS O-acetylase OafA/YrhL